VSPKKRKHQDSYSAKNLRALEGLEAVRTVPGMYIGSTGPKGLLHMAEEIWANSVDEHLAGYGNEIIVTITEDNWCTVQDFGRGIPVDIHPDTGLPGVEMVLTTLHGGGKFRDESSSYEISGGMHGVGSSVVNALSKEMRVVVHRDGYEWTITFREGKTHKPLKKGRKVSGTGTTVSFLYDDKVMQKGMSFERADVTKRLRELAYLNPNLTVRLHFHDHDEEVFHYPGGLRDYIRDEVAALGTAPRHPDPIVLSAKINDEVPNKDGEMVPMRSYADIALQWTDSDRVDPSKHSFVNIINTYQGGTHVKGAETGLRKTLNEVAEELGKLRAKDERFIGEDVREGLVWVVLHKLPNPHFESQVKHTLSNPEVQKRIEMFVCEHLKKFLLEKRNRDTAERIIDRVIEARDARIAAGKAKKLIQRKSGLLGGGGLPGKLQDCKLRDPEKTELFLVEGDSAGGNLAQTRDRNTQAVLPLRGKIINAEKEGEGVFKSQAIQDILAAIGGAVTDVKVPVRKNGKVAHKTKLLVDVSEPRYGKIILATDADVDGGHIQTLLLTFFYRYAPSLLRDGRIYIAEPPLYKVEHVKKGTLYLRSDEELQALIRKDELKKNPDGTHKVTRFKGLGEMNAAQTKETLVNPDTRSLRRVVVDDPASADEITTLLMGRRVEPRREFIEDHALTDIADV
jgi:DNA gyrase subunit B